MENRTSKKANLAAFLEIYDFHTRFFINAIEGFSDVDSHNRLNTKANHVAWLAGSVVHERFELANAVGIALKQTSDALFSNHKGIQENTTYPHLDEYRKDWATISPLLRTAFASLSEEELAGADPFDMPGGDYTLFDSITFCLDRESYCIGQIGLWRRLLDYPPVRYE